MAAVATKLVIVIAVILGSGCHANQDTTLLSEQYRVCATLPKDASFHARVPGPDYEVGTLYLNGIVVEVLIGGHPGFTLETRKSGLHARDHFRFLGKESSGGQDRILLGHNRGERRGPLFIVFSATDLQPVEHELVRKDFVVDCGINSSHGYGKR